MKINYFQMPLQSGGIESKKALQKQNYFQEVSPIRQIKQAMPDNIQFEKLVSKKLPTLSTQNQYSRSLESHYDMPKMMKLFEEQSAQKNKQISKLNQEYKYVQKNLFSEELQKNVQIRQKLPNFQAIQNKKTTYDQIIDRKSNEKTKLKTLQATFKPQQLNNQKKFNKNGSCYLTKSSSSNNIKKGKHHLQGYLLGNGNVVAKTKYEKILANHLDIQKRKSKNNKGVQQPVKAQDSFKPSRQKDQQLQLETYKEKNSKRQSNNVRKANFSSTKSQKKIIKQSKQFQKSSNANARHSSEVKNQVQRVNNYQKLIRRQQKTNNKTQKQLQTQRSASGLNGAKSYRYSSRTSRLETHRDNRNHSYQPVLKKGGWTQMSFYERQQQVLESRRNKQKAGQKIKQKEQTKGCTFHPQLWSNRPNNTNRLMTLPQSKQSLTYLGQYLDKLYPRY